MDVRINTRSLSAKIEKLEQIGETKVKEKLYDIAENISTRTPVDTGALAESFSVVPASSGSGRMASKEGRPGNRDIGQFRQLALANMAADIQGLQLKDNTRVAFRNRAVHFPYVNRKQAIFDVAKDIYR